MLQTALFGIKLAELEENKGVNDSSRSERGPRLQGWKDITGRKTWLKAMHSLSLTDTHRIMQA